MSEQLQCKVAPDDSIRVSKGRVVSGDQRVNIFVCEEDSGHSQCTSVEVSRAEFLAAVAAELDAVIIPREELPTPDVHEDRADLAKVGHLTASRNGLPGRSAELRERGLDYLAAAEWAAEGAAEAQVEAIAVALADARRDTDGRNETWFYEEARRLYAAGVRVGGDDK